MPTYGYECGTCGDRFEVVQKITEDALKVHEGCGGPLKKLVYPVGISFKGSGFYVNDYAAKPAGSATKTAEPTKSDSGATEAKTEIKSETKTEAKTDSASPAPAKTESKAAAT